MTSAATGAKRLLSSASRILRTADPVEQLAPFIDESLHLPPGAAEYRRPHAFETHFSERTPRRLELGMTMGDPEATVLDRVGGATRAMRLITGRNFGPQAVRWLDGRTEALRTDHGDAWVTSGFDRDGVQEAQVTYSWGPQTTDALARQIHDTVQAAMDAMPSLRPALTTVRCARTFGSQEVSFRVEGALRLSELRPLMDRLGLGDQHTRVVNALAFVLGARFTLPPDTALISLRPTRAGMEMRLDVDLEGIPDVPANVSSLLQLQLVERPQSLAALEQWVVAMTPQSNLSPGSLSVLSVTARPHGGPCLALDMRPSVVTEESTPAPAPRPSTVSAAVAGRSPWDPRS
ncbi:hypothetical protein [Streptomyces sp. HUAS ZL42]|uniref:hypothetical protein n=1 Tax=Streptomyces sp. HUAS ZL42 TaxID=3231715 RepID=UPI00345E96E4